jgi:hypothetical protein
LTAAGWLLYTERVGEWMESARKSGQYAAAGGDRAYRGGAAVWPSARENLVRAMLTGMKAGRQGEPDQAPRTLIALLLLLAVLAFWWLQLA